jgi:hypothetical protein
MTSQSIVSEFNEILSSFLKQITPIVGNSYYNNFNLLSEIQPNLVIEQFLVNALPVRDKILNRDESYFLETNHGDKTDSENIMQEIFKIQTIYTQLDDDSKSNLWDIVKAMLFLGEEYIRLNQNKFVNN